MTERLHFSLSSTGEGNGNPLQCSYLENPRDGGAWWAAVYGVAQSWTRLKRPQQQQQQGIAGRLTEQRTEQIPEDSKPAVDWPIPCQKQEGRWWQPKMERGDLSHRDDIIYQTVSRLLAANQVFLVFLGSWMVDISREGRSQISAPQRRQRHT